MKDNNFDRLDAGDWETVVDPTVAPVPPDGSQMVSRPLVETPGPHPKQTTPEAEAARTQAMGQNHGEVWEQGEGPQLS